ncbi:hypothetical protein HPB51_019133 [Rhipicephalus microplus]|uniref:Tnf receptor-associated factor n=1 Tax=Rhipicephalus microplus TaxID=6941 RepID=A0A9J6EI11_RHIMP|nr:hypothetical protein HPB51_019133 [Rhipicephalus microplus]
MEEKHIHRFCHEEIRGVNWRPTRLAATVPSSCVCSVCGVIPMWRVRLPCSHVLCPVCHDASSSCGAGQCPLDGQPFRKKDSVNVHFPGKEARNFKTVWRRLAVQCSSRSVPFWRNTALSRQGEALARSYKQLGLSSATVDDILNPVHCWNEAFGCRFVSTLGDLLWHYESDCLYHVVECSKCTQVVLHDDLVKHHKNGCGTASSHSAEQSSPLESAAATPRNWLENPTMLLRDPCSQLPGITTLIYKAVEHAKTHEAWLKTCTSNFKASMLKLKQDMAEMSKVVSSTTSRENSAGVSLSAESEATVVLRKLEHFANMSINQFELMQQMVIQLAEQRSVIVDCKPLAYFLDSYNRLSNALSAENGLSNEISRQVYALHMENAEELFSCAPESKKLAELDFVRSGGFLQNGCLMLEIQFDEA